MSHSGVALKGGGARVPGGSTNELWVIWERDSKGRASEDRDPEEAKSRNSVEEHGDKEESEERERV
jgi:hypothetical protein